MEVNGGMAPDVNGSTAESQHHGSNGNGNGHRHHHHQQGYTMFLGADMGSGGLGVGDGGGGASMGGRNRREFRRTNWTVGECLVLQDAKREDYERQTNGGAKEKHRTAAERWLAVEDFCWANEVHRSGQQCKDRWEKMSADFKKVFDYERNATTGQTSFWQMTLEDKKAKRLPSTFFLEVYKGLTQWFGRGAGSGGAGGAGGGAAVMMGGGAGGGGVRVNGELQAANGVRDNLGSLLREREASGKAGSNGNYSGSEDGESEEPATEAMFDSSSGKKRNSDGDVLMGDRNGGTSGRDYRRTNWTLPESIVLQAAKREDLDKQYGSGPKERHLSAAERWQVVEDYCWARGVHRSGQQCRDRWDKLSSDFKKISDYEKQFPDGQNPYWMMTPEEKKSKRLPSTFWLDVYSAMTEWFGKNRNIDLRVMIHDTSQPAPREASGNEDFFGSDDEGSDPGSAPVINSSAGKERKSDGDVLIGGGDGHHGRDYRKTNWTLQESMVLQAVKQDDFERQAKEEHLKEADRWQAVEDFCWEQNIYRSGQQCKDRWEQMTVDFKKIYHYQRRSPSGENYWMLTEDQRKAKRLPLTFWRELFNVMVKWFTKDRTGGSGNATNDLEAQQQEGSGKAGSNEDFSDADEGESDPVSDAFRNARPRKKRKPRFNSRESLAVIMEQSRLATQKIMLECEDRKDRRLEKSIEADVQRLERTLDANERIAMTYCQAFVALADAIRSIASKGSHD